MAENRAKLVAEAMGVVQELDASEVDACEQINERLEPKLAGPEYRTNGFFDGKEKLDKEHPEYDWFNLAEEAVVTTAEPEENDLGFRRRRIPGAESVLAADHQPRADDEGLGLFVLGAEMELAAEHQSSTAREELGSFVPAPQVASGERPYVELSCRGNAPVRVKSASGGPSGSMVRPASQAFSVVSSGELPLQKSSASQSPEDRTSGELPREGTSASA